MTRKNMLKIALTVTLALAAGSAIAATAVTGAISMGGGSFAPSNNVTIVAGSTASTYTAASKHLNGDRTIGTTNTDPKMYFKTTIAAGTALTTSDIPDFSSGTSGWTSL